MQVNPSETWLSDECDGTAFFPQEDGSFNLSSLKISLYTTLVVEGLALSVTMLPRLWPLAGPLASAPLIPWPPLVAVASTALGSIFIAEATPVLGSWFTGVDLGGLSDE